MTTHSLQTQLSKTRQASFLLTTESPETKNRVLTTLAQLLSSERKQILEANAQDLEALPQETTMAFRDRLVLNDKRIHGMIESIEKICELTDPVGATVETRTLANQLILNKVRAPLGVLFLIFESRPNVAIEAFALAFKAGNPIILRGGKESQKSTGLLYQLMSRALKEENISPDCLWGITDSNREIVTHLLQAREHIDVVIPRGGDGLISYVVNHSKIPIIKNDRGLCHTYIDAEADLDMARDIAVNAKAQRPGVCNSMETLLIHKDIANSFLLDCYKAMAPHNVEWFCDKDSQEILKGQDKVSSITEDSYDTEYLDFKINCRIVSSTETAIEHIRQHGSRHSECIVTKNPATAKLFQQSTDAAAVYWNASTRFTDGFEFGLGGEIGISTQKIHVRGPVGLNELTSLKWIIEGTGQTR